MSTITGDGHTGLVGPNGCGKSNVVDALRWAMGEGNARTLRGAEMEDVIFAGTVARPGLHQAEVALTLDGGSFPAPFTDLAAVQVTRRIERGAGSVYQVNGREARARDVQALFTDLAGGARSFAMVGQGRVGALVQARPEERRGCSTRPRASPACAPAVWRRRASCAPPRPTCCAPATAARRWTRNSTACAGRPAKRSGTVSCPSASPWRRPGCSPSSAPAPQQPGTSRRQHSPRRREQRPGL